MNGRDYMSPTHISEINIALVMKPRFQKMNQIRTWIAPKSNEYIFMYKTYPYSNVRLLYWVVCRDAQHPSHLQSQAMFSTSLLDTSQACGSALTSRHVWTQWNSISNDIPRPNHARARVLTRGLRPFPVRLIWRCFMFSAINPVDYNPKQASF